MSLQQYDIRYPELPLAVYREIAAHLGQLEGVETELLPQDAQEFDYMQSQIGWLRISHPETLSDEDRSQLTRILEFYAERFGPWTRRSDVESAS